MCLINFIVLLVEIELKGGLKRMAKHNQIQIRVIVDKVQVDELKKKAKELKLTLEHYSGLVLSGFELKRKDNNGN